MPRNTRNPGPQGELCTPDHVSSHTTHAKLARRQRLGGVVVSTLMAMLLSACGNSSQDQVIADSDRNGGTVSAKDTDLNPIASAQPSAVTEQSAAPADTSGASAADDDEDDGADPVAKALSNITGLPTSKPKNNTATAATATGTAAGSTTTPGTSPAAGTRPAEPAKPATPASGTSPNTGTAPVAGAKPAEPAKPATPTSGTSPNTGTAPVAGAKPAEPAKPATPASGTSPNTGTAPVAGAKPAEPAKPATPAGGTSPNTGTAPVAGAKPAEPAKPATPAGGTSPNTGTAPVAGTKPATAAVGTSPTTSTKPATTATTPATGTVTAAKPASATPPTAATAPSSQTQPTTAAPSGSNGEHRFVVMFKQHVTNPHTRSNEISTKHGGKLRHAYGNAVRGFAITVSDTGVDAFLKSMDMNPDVAIVEEDIVIRASQTSGSTQTNATWGLDRVDQRDLPLNGGYGYASNGSSVRAYVVDTGILSSHVDFNGRVGAGFSAINDGYGTGDCNGHGTHVAGTIGGATWGVAKAVNLVPVRVLDCTGSGSLSGVIAGLDWIATHGIKPAVVNMSLGGAVSSALDTAVSNVINAGFTVVVAAGNENADACYSSPARTPAAITVGASTNADARATFSNWGTCVDVFAPGAAIASTWHTSTVATATLNGTSMASPHVAGHAALALAANPSATPAQIAETVRTGATPNKVTTAGTGSPNLLLFTGAISTVTPPPPTTTTRTVLIAGLVGKGTLSRKGWSAAISVTVKDASGAVVPGAVVKGDFTLGGVGLSCTTNTSGVCALKSGNLSTSTASTSFAVKAVTGTNLSYDASRNTVSSIVIAKP